MNGMNYFERKLISSVLSIPWDFGSDERKTALINCKPDAKAIENEAEKTLESLNKPGVNNLRYRFIQSGESRKARDRLLDLYFEQSYAKEPGVLIECAQVIDTNSASRYPLWKRVFLIRLPKRASELLQDGFVNFVVGIALGDQAKKLIDSAYRVNQTLIGGKVVPFVINNVPIQVIRFGNRIMDGVDFVAHRKYKLAAYLIAAQLVCSLMATAFKKMWPTEEERGVVQGRFGVLENWGVTPKGLPQPLHLVFRIVNFVSLKFIWNFAFYAPISSATYFYEQTNAFQTFIQEKLKAVGTCFAYLGDSFMQERHFVAKGKTYQVWKALTARYQPGATEPSQPASQDVESSFGTKCRRAFSRFETPLAECLTYLVEVVALYLLLKRYPPRDVTTHLLMFAVFYNLGSHLWEMKGNALNRIRFQIAKSEDGIGPAALAIGTTAAIGGLARGLFAYTVFQDFKK